MGITVSKLKWDLVFNVLSEEQKARVLELALRIMPTEPPEPPEPEDLECLAGRQETGDSFVFSSAEEIADYFGVPLQK
jgi:hypothetical protein